MPSWEVSNESRCTDGVTGESYIKEHRNVIFLGKSGAGKTHMATALGLEAVTSHINLTPNSHNLLTRFKTV